MPKRFLPAVFNKKKSTAEGNHIVAQLNDRVMPIDRGLVYEDPLDEFLKENQYGEVTGGGTLQKDTGELVYCDIEIKLAAGKMNKSVVTAIMGRLEMMGAPKGSKLIIERTKEEISFGKKEGLALYIDGQNLPKEVYAECDINFVLSELHHLTGIEPDADRNWQGETETALYFFNDSFEQMKSSVSKFIDTYPLCKGARVVQIA